MAAVHARDMGNNEHQQCAQMLAQPPPRRRKKVPTVAHITARTVAWPFRDASRPPTASANCLSRCRLARASLAAAAAEDAAASGEGADTGSPMVSGYSRSSQG